MLRCSWVCRVGLGRILSQLAAEGVSPLLVTQLFRALAKETDKKLKHSYHPVLPIAWSEILAISDNACFLYSGNDAHAVLTAMSRIRQQPAFPTVLVLKIASEGIRASLADGNFRTAARLCSLLGALNVGPSWSESEISKIQAMVASVAEQLPLFLEHEAAPPEALGSLAESCWKFRVFSDQLVDILAEQINNHAVHFPALAVLQISRFLAISDHRGNLAWRAISRRVQGIALTARDLRLMLENFAHVGVRDEQLLSEISSRLERMTGGLSAGDCVSVAESLASLSGDRKFVGLYEKLEKRLQTSLVTDVQSLARVNETVRSLAGGRLLSVTSGKCKLSIVSSCVLL